MRISDWSSDVCSSDLTWRNGVNGDVLGAQALCQRFHHPMDGCLRSCVSINFARPHLQCADRSDIDNCRRALMRRSGSEEWQELLRDRKSVVSGKSVSVRVGLGGRRLIKKKTKQKNKK